MDRALDNHKTKRPNNHHYNGGKAEQTVHVNRVCPLLETLPTYLTEPQSPSVNWCPPLFAHQEEIESSPATLSAPQATFPAPVTTLGETS